MITIEQRKKNSLRYERFKNKNPGYHKEYAEKNLTKKREASQKWRDTHPEKHTEFNFNIRFKLLNFTYQDYLKLSKKQGNVCAICKKPEKNKRLATDHCHTKNKVRGLLCHNCNSLLGHAKDNIEILKLAIKYLKKYE